MKKFAKNPVKTVAFGRDFAPTNTLMSWLARKFPGFHFRSNWPIHWISVKSVDRPFCFVTNCFRGARSLHFPINYLQSINQVTLDSGLEIIQTPIHTYLVHMCAYQLCVMPLITNGEILDTISDMFWKLKLFTWVIFVKILIKIEHPSIQSVEQQEWTNQYLLTE